MHHRFAKTCTAALLSLCLAIGAVGASASPARAENNSDVAAVLGGLLALFAIGRAIDIHNDRNNRHVAPPPPQHRPQPPALVAPSRCFIEGWDNGQRYRGYVRRCMLNNVAQVNRLPDRCLRLVHTERGPRNIYGGRCLAQNGWVRG